MLYFFFKLKTFNGPASRRINNSGAEGDLNCGILAQEVSQNNFSMWPRDHSWDVLSKNVNAFCPCPKTFA